MEKGDKEAIIAAIAQFSEGASLSQLRGVLGDSVTRRTLQRRLKEMEEAGEIRSAGRMRGKRYFAAHTASSVQALKEYVNQPLSRREPVPYHRDWLERYLPNQTFYLSAGHREELSSLEGGEQAGSPAGTFARRVYHTLLIDLSWNSSRLEGNTYSLLDTERLIAHGEQAEGHSPQEAQMILNHKAAIDFLLENVGELKLDRHTICGLHALLSDNLMMSQRDCGRIRSRPVGIRESAYEPPAIPQQIEELFDLVLAKAGLIENAFEQAFFLMTHLPYLQAFEDVNKRVSRLAANLPLMKANLCPLSFVDVNQKEYIDALLAIYECNNTALLEEVFVWAYKKSVLKYGAMRQVIGEPDSIRLKYREQIKALIHDLVSRGAKPARVSQEIKKWAVFADEPERDRLIELVERELLALHEGNIAIYGVSLAEFREWARKGAE